METAAFEIVQDQSVGNGFKTVALRIRGINEETQELDETLSTIKSDLYDLTGISVMQDEVTYKSTYQILKEISGVWDDLTDKAQTETLELMFGKLRSNIGASVIKNFSAAEKAMDDMANSAGNAEAEMSIMADSISYKLNKLQETSTGIAQNLFDRDDMKMFWTSLILWQKYWILQLKNLVYLVLSDLVQKLQQALKASVGIKCNSLLF